MNKNEQAQLCMLLAKLRYDVMESMINASSKSYLDDCRKLIDAINKVLTYTSIDGSNK